MLPELTTPRLVLRPWTPDDVEDAFVLYGDPEVTRHIGGYTPPDLEAAREHLALRIAKVARYPAGLGAWAARHDGTLVGSGLLKPLPDTLGAISSDIEVGWHVVRSRWGEGYATEIGRRLLEFGHEHHGLDVIHAVMEPPNTRSMRVAERLGMVHEGQTTAYYGGEALEHYRWTA